MATTTVTRIARESISSCRCYNGDLRRPIRTRISSHYRLLRTLRRDSPVTGRSIQLKAQMKTKPSHLFPCITSFDTSEPYATVTVNGVHSSPSVQLIDNNPNPINVACMDVDDARFVHNCFSKF